MSIPGTGSGAAVAIPYVEIVNCCDTSDRSLFNIDGFDYVNGSGVYEYTGAGFTVGAMTFVAGNCYTIVHPGNAGTPYPVISAVEFADFSYFSNDVSIWEN